jgi:hypothetical protein
MTFPIRRCVVVTLSLAASAGPAWAQRGGPGFLFQAPTVSFGIRTGYDRALAGSDLFAFSTDNLTLDRGAFSSTAWAGDMGIWLSPRTDLVLGIAYTGSTRGSEFRNWVDNNNQPIVQRTTFRRLPLTAMLKGYLTPRGHSVGRFAWVPARYAPWVGVGAGFIWYKFRQAGDFIDFNTLKVFSDAYNSSGWTQTLLARGGLDVAMTSHLALSAELGYAWAKAPLGEDFRGFHRLDLSGVSGTAGLSMRF